MAKISEETRLHFAEVIKPYKEKITQTLEKEKTMLNGMHKGDVDFHRFIFSHKIKIRNLNSTRQIQIMLLENFKDFLCL